MSADAADVIDAMNAVAEPTATGLMRALHEEGVAAVLAGPTRSGIGATTDRVAAQAAALGARVVRLRAPREGPLELQSRLASLLETGATATLGPAALIDAIRDDTARTPGAVLVIVEDAHRAGTRELQYLWLLRCLATAAAVPWQLLLAGEASLLDVLRAPALAELDERLTCRLMLPRVSTPAEDLAEDRAPAGSVPSGAAFFADAAAWTARQGLGRPPAPARRVWRPLRAVVAAYPARTAVIAAVLVGASAAALVRAGPHAAGSLAPRPDARAGLGPAIAAAVVVAAAAPPQAASVTPAPASGAPATARDQARAGAAAGGVAAADKAGRPAPERAAAAGSAAPVAAGATALATTRLAGVPAAVRADRIVLPEGAPTRIVLSVRADAPTLRPRAMRVMDALRLAGLPVESVIAAPARGVAGLQVGYFFPQDRVGAEAVLRALSGYGADTPARLLPLPKALPAPGTVQVAIAPS